MKTDTYPNLNIKDFDPITDQMILRNKNDLDLKTNFTIDLNQNSLKLYAIGPFEKNEDIRIFIFDKVLVIQAALTKNSNHVNIKHDILSDLNSGYLTIKSSQIKLPDNYRYNINQFKLQEKGLLEIELRIEHDYKHN